MAVFLLFHTICLALLIVGLTGGLWIAAYGEGGLLSPLLRWLEGYGRSKALLQSWLDAEAELNKAMMKGDVDTIKLLTEMRDRARYRYNRYAIWRKPILTCVRCMPSLWGTLLGVTLCLCTDLMWLSIPLAIPMASTINALLFTHIKM